MPAIKSLFGSLGRVHVVGQGEWEPLAKPDRGSPAHLRDGARGWMSNPYADRFNPLKLTVDVAMWMLSWVCPRTMARRIALQTLGVSVLLGGCRGATEPLSELGAVPDGVFMTDATGYVAHRIAGTGAVKRYRFTVITRYENRSATSVFLGRCFPASPQPLFTVVHADASVESGYEYVWGCVGHDQQFAIPPGAVRVDTLQVEGPNRFDGVTHEPIGVTTGRFKLYFDVRSAAGDGALFAPMALRLSNEFLFRTAD